MKNKWLTDDQISSLPSPSVISRENCVSKITPKERSWGVDKPAHSGGWQRLWPPISMINWGYFPVFPLKAFMAEQNVWRCFLGGRWVHHLPRLLAFWLKALFLFTICEYWFCKQQAAGPPFDNNENVLFFFYNVLYLNWSGGYTCVYNWQNLELYI